MAKHHIDENQLEELLQNMPKISDHRNSDEIYRNLHIKMNRTQKNKKLFFVPALTVMAATIFFILISPAFLQEKRYENRSADMVSHKDIAHSNVSDSNAKAQKSQQVKANVFTDQTNDKQIKRTAVYEQDINGGNALFTYGVFTEDSVVVPVSIVTPKTGDNWAAHYKTIAIKLLAKNKLLDNYLPLHGDISFDPNTKKVHVIITKSVIPSITEQFQMNLDRIVQYSFAYQDVKEVDFTDENGKPIELSEIGKVANRKINKAPHTAFYLYQTSSGEKYLLPTDEQYLTLQKALEAMKAKPDDFHIPVIPEDVNVHVNTDNNTEQATVQFRNSINLQNIENPMNLIEGILLTAKNFGYTSVSFKNISPIQWNGFDFSSPIKVPVAPNRMNIE